MPRKGEHLTEEAKRKIGLANKGYRHGLWKGDRVSYKSLHAWVGRNYGKPMICDRCGKRKKWIDWANVSGRYSRRRADWIRLCRKCHYDYDFGDRNPNAKLTKRQIEYLCATKWKYGITKRLAKRFGVERHTISRYIQRA